ncbi:MAG: hypothetical protein V4694_01720 [Pseudomonadota bacterium]
MSKSVVQNPPTIQEEVPADLIDSSDVSTVTDNTIKNAAKITDAMRFNSAGAASAFAAIGGILQNKDITNEQKKAKIAEQSKDVEDTALQVYANMAMGMLGSSEKGATDEKEAPGIEKLSKAFEFLGHKIEDKDAAAKDNRLAEMAGAYASLMNDKEINEDTKKVIGTAFKENPDMVKVAEIQKDIEKQTPEEEQEGEEASASDERDASQYDGKKWEQYKRNAIYGAKGAIAIGLCFAPGGIFLAALFLYATKDFGRNPDDIEKEQKAEEEAALESEKSLEFLNAFKKYLEPAEKEKENEGEEKEEVVETDVDDKPRERKSGEKITAVGEKAEEFVEEQEGSLKRTEGTLATNQKGLERVDVQSVAASTVDEVTKAALASVIGGLGGANMEEHEDKTTSHGVTTPQIGGAAKGKSA